MRVVIIGAGAAGISAAETIRRYNADWPITVVSKEKSMPFSPVGLPEYIEGRIPAKHLFLWDDVQVQKQHVDLILGKAVVSIHPNEKRVIMDDGASLLYDKLLIASGASPMLPDDLRNIRGVFTLRTLADAQAIRDQLTDRVIIYGAGAIAVKIAIALRRAGIDTIMFCRSRVLRRLFDQDICQLIHDLLVANGIKIVHIQETPRIIGNPVERVSIGAEEFKCKTLIAALGVAPNTSFVNAQKVRLGSSAGIITNAKMETSAVDIYAAGDCTETWDIILQKRFPIALWPPAVEHAKVAALNMLGINAIYEGTLSQNMIDIFGTALASIGSVDGEKIDILKGRTINRFTVRNELVVGAQLVGEVDNAGFISSCIKRGIGAKDLLKLFATKKPNLLAAITFYQLFRRHVTQSERK
jgi:NADPH-dependent 2,4-dienoyl-CoA reductase/sulfur reductase-like enzyme